MKITVITACWNSEKHLADCIASVASQTYRDVEHWIVDGGSTDGTLALVENHKNDRIRLNSEKDGGIYHALNRGISLASGDVICFLNSDDVYAHENVLAQAAAALSENPKADACYADLVYVKEDDLSDVVRYWKSEPFRPGLFKGGWMPPHPTFIARSDVYDKLNGFNTALPIGSDFEFLMRFFEIEKLRGIYVPETWIRMRLGGVSNHSWKNILNNNLDTWRVCRHALGFWGSALFPVRKLAHRLRQFGSHRGK